MPGDMTNCSICIKPLTVTTGFFTTSCGHQFHLRCIVHWLLMSNVEDCPMCRHKMGYMERMPVIGEDSLIDTNEKSDSEDSISSVEEDSEPLILNIANRRAFLLIRGRNDSIESVDSTKADIIENALSTVERTNTSLTTEPIDNL